MLGLTVLGSGSRGNSLLVHNSTGGLLIDVGFSLRETRRRMAQAEVDERVVRAILISHEHSDHVKGLRAAARHFAAPVYCNRGTGEMMRDRGISPERLHLFASGVRFDVDGFTVEPFPIPHDAIDPVGFVIRHGDHKIGVVTDLGHAGGVVCHHLQECDIVVLESNHDITLLRESKRPWSLKQRIVGRHGHLSNEASMELLEKVLHERTRHVVLAHASSECNRYDLVESCVAEMLAAKGRHDIQALVARQDDGLPTLWVD